MAYQVDHDHNEDYYGVHVYCERCGRFLVNDLVPKEALSWYKVEMVCADYGGQCDPLS